MPIIEQVGAREILDSRGNPTVEVEVACSTGRCRPRRGALRRVDRRARGRRAPRRRRPATAARASRRPSRPCSTRSRPRSSALDADEQRLVDQALLDLDGTPDKSRLGANAILGVSLAVAKAAARVGRAAAVPLRRRPERAHPAGADDEHRQRRRARRHRCRRPGVHGRPDRRADLQGGAALGRRGLPLAEVGAQEAGPVHRSRRRGRLRPRHRRHHGRAGPDQRRRSRRAGLKLGTDVALALDVAATEFYTEGTGYAFEKETRTAEQMTAFYAELLDAYPLVSIEDPLSEDDWDGWVALTAAIGDKVQIVGDDLFVTNPERLEDGIEQGAANALLVKVNQIGTLTETLDAVALAHNSGYRTMMSHRVRRDRGHHHRRPRGRGGQRPDQDRRAGPQRARRQVQPAAAHRGGARRRRPLRRRPGVPAVRVWRRKEYAAVPERETARPQADAAPASRPGKPRPGRPARREVRARRRCGQLRSRDPHGRGRRTRARRRRR